MRMRVLRMLLAVAVAATLTGTAASADEFQPSEDGFSFKNTGGGRHTWELFKRTYLGVHPVHVCAAAWLDCLFYELFQISGKEGNCGGISALAQSLYRDGGYMGFCCPAFFYEGGDDNLGPKLDDLQEVISILQARQFTARTVRYFFKAYRAGERTVGSTALNCVEESLAKRDMPVLWLSNNPTMGDAHTIVAYGVTRGAEEDRIWVWDSNFPYSKKADWYDSKQNYIRVDADGQGWHYEGAPRAGAPYPFSWEGQGNIICAPLSIVREKDFHAMSDSSLATSIQELVFIQGGSVVAVDDADGESLYPRLGRRSAGEHGSSSDVLRWPWLGGAPEGVELYFVHASERSRSLEFTVVGDDFDVVFGNSRGFARVQGSSPRQAPHKIGLLRFGERGQELVLRASSAGGAFSVSQLRTTGTQSDWRRFDVEDLRVEARSEVSLRVLGEAEGVIVTARDKGVRFRAKLARAVDGVVEQTGRAEHSVDASGAVGLTPSDWVGLGRAKVVPTEFSVKRSGPAAYLAPRF